MAEKKKRTDSSSWPDRRDFLKISATVGTTLAVGLGSLETSASVPTISLDRSRVRPGGEVTLTVHDLPASMSGLPVHIVEVDAEGALVEHVETIRARRVEGGAEARFVPRRRGARESFLLAGVVLVEGGRQLVSTPVEVICTFQLPGL